MNKWYIRRDFSVAAAKMGKRDIALSSGEPPADAVFWEMWNECEDIARQVLDTDYFRGIRDNNLDPNAYGSLMVQDAYYCFEAASPTTPSSPTPTTKPMWQATSIRPTSSA